MSMVNSKAVRNQVLAAIKTAIQDKSNSNIDIEISHHFDSGKIAQTKKYQAQDLVTQFISVLEDYRAVTEITKSDQISIRLKQMISRCPVSRLVVPSGLDSAWLSELQDFEIIKDDGSLSVQELAQFDGVITGSSYSLASSGTIVLTSAPSEGRRALSLLPDYHFCVVSSGDCQVS